MGKYWFLIVSLLAVGPVPLVSATASDLAGRTIIVAIEPQPWQVRRADLAKTINAIQTSRGKDQQAIDRIDALLTAMERNPAVITPMEAMDVFGAYYVPLEGATNMKPLLSMISAFATLGWYDSLRYADVSGRAEIVNNEKFFLRPFVLAGRESVQLLKDFLNQHPDDAAAAVEKGIGIARVLRTGDRQDEDWPSAYGLARTACAMEGKKTCPKPPPMPRENWDAAFEEAAARVRHYYRVNK